MTDTADIYETVSRATRSSHLQHVDKPCDVDTLGALGMASTTNVLSSMVFRLKYGNEARFYRPALALVTVESKRLAQRHGWNDAPAAALARMNRAALDFFLADRCADCEGRGYETIVGAPVLSNVACGVCLGTGKRWPPDLGSAEVNGWQDQLLARLYELEWHAGGDVIRRLARRLAAFEGVR